MSTTHREEVLFKTYSKGWNKYMPSTLIRYDSGNIDYHCQTGDHHMKALKRAKRYLRRRGLCIVNEEYDFIGMTGAYYTVMRVGA